MNKKFLFKRSIVRYMFLSYLLANVLIFLLLGYMSLRDSTRSLTSEVVRYSKREIEQAALNVNYNLNDVKQPLMVLANDSSVIQLMKAYPDLKVDAMLNLERTVMSLSSSVSSFKPLISDILFIGKNGYINNLSNRRTLQWNYPFTQKSWFIQSVSTNSGDFDSLGLIRQDYYLDYIGQYNQYTLAISIPVYDYNQKIIGSIVCTLVLDKLNNLFDLSADDKKSSIFMLDKEGTFIVSNNRGDIGTAFPIVLNGSHINSFVTDYKGQSYLLIYHSTDFGGWKIVSLVPVKNIESHSRHLKWNIFVLMGLFVVLNVFIAHIITLKIALPIKRLLNTLDNITDGNMNQVPRNFIYQELNQIGDKVRELLNRIYNLINQNYRSQLALKEAQIQALLSQINPHFLFNMLQLLQTTVVSGDRMQSNDIIVSMSSLLRYSTYSATDYVTVEQELNYIQDYLYILKKKYSDRLQYEIEVNDPMVRAMSMPKFILQPIVENCIKHGFEDFPKKGKIRIRVSLCKRGLSITIIDNGKGMDEQELSTLRRQLSASGEEKKGIGLSNVNQRIQLLAGNTYGITVASTPNRFTAIHVLLPMDNNRRSKAIGDECE